MAKKKHYKTVNKGNTEVERLKLTIKKLLETIVEQDTMLAKKNIELAELRNPIKKMED